MRTTWLRATLATAVTAMVLAAAGPAAAQTSAPANDRGTAAGAPMGPGMMGGYGHMGPGMMQGYGMRGGAGEGTGYPMGPGMMRGSGYGMGPGMMGPGMMDRGGMYGAPGIQQYGYVRPPLNLTVTDVQGYFADWIARTGNPNLKVGKVTEKDNATITVDVVTKDNSLVREYEVDRATGFFHPAG